MSDRPPADGVFADPPRTARQLGQLHEAYLASGSQYPLARFAEFLEGLMQGASDPDLCLNTLVRLSESAVSRTSLFNDLLHYPVMAELFRALAGSSSYISDILVRDPALFRWLSTSNALDHVVSRAEFRAETDRIRELFPRPERRLEGLKRYHRREFLRIGARDLLGLAGMQETTRQLSALADASVDAVCSLSGEQLGVPLPGAFVILGMGKLGGEELNYSSDIDLIFLFEPDAGPPAGRKRSRVAEHDPHATFNRLGEKIVQNLSTPSAEGYFYRVDMRLRPESGSGPLTRSVRSTLLYYETRGELWERQMLIKARPVAGDLPLGEEFLRQIVPFVYPRTFLHHPADYIARIKARIELSVGEAQNVKLMRGGIRDIEFIVQSLQLLHGGTLPPIRVAGTMAALDACRAAGLLSSEETETLASAYVFLRTVEHRLQVVANAQTHTLPDSPRDVEILARRCGLADEGALRSALEQRRVGVRRVFDRVLSGPDAGNSEGIMALIDGGVEEGRIQSVFSGYGFRDSRTALRNLRHLVHGSALTDAKGFDARTRNAFAEVAPDLFTHLAKTPDPDLTFRGLTTILTSRQFPGQYYALLREERFRRLLIDVCKVSPRMARGLATDPLLLESVATDPGGITPIPTDEFGSPTDTAAFKARGELAAGLRHLLGFTDLDGLTGDLSALADRILGAFFERGTARKKGQPVPLAVLAVGKYGTRELLFDADLDLLFVAPDTRGGTHAMQTAAGEILRGLTSVSERGHLYEADARLRPEGKNAPLAVSVSAWERYLRERSSLWERQSLTRLRVAAGGGEWLDSALAMVEKHVFDAPLPVGWNAEIVAMRKRMETRSRFHGTGPVDVKVGAGGMVDIEFIAQMIQLRHGRARGDLRGKRTVEVLERSTPTIISADESTYLTAAYRRYREIEKLLRIALEQHGMLLPEGEELELLSRCLGEESGRALASAVDGMMKEVRRIFLDLGRRME